MGQDGLEATHEVEDILVVRVVIEYSIPQAFEGAVVHKRQDAERAIVHFINGDVAGELSQGPIKVLGVDLADCLFSPPDSTQFWMVA